MSQTKRWTYDTEFPDFGELDVTIPDGFTDTSWHNDVSPSFEGLGVRIWVDYKKPEDREFQDHKRFMVVEQDAQLVGQDNLLLETDDWAEVLAFVERRKTKG